MANAAPEHFKQLAEMLGVGLVIVDRQGALCYIGPPVLRLLEYPEPGATVPQWTQFNLPEFEATDAEAWHQILTTGKCPAYEKVYLSTSARRVPILLSGSLLNGEDGQLRVAITIVDLTERKQNERTAFLGRLDDALRTLAEPAEIVRTACRFLGEHLHADRCGYCVMEADDQMLEIMADYTRPGVRSIVGRYRLSDFGRHTERLYRADLPEVLDDIENDPNIVEGREAYRAVAIRAHASVPLHKGGKLVAAIGVHQTTPRKWTPEEVELVRMVANRCWESIERVRAAQALHMSERRLRLAQKAGRIGVFEWLFADDLITWSSEMEALYNLPEGAFEGSWEGWRKRIVSEDAERIRADVEACIAQKKPDYSFEFRAVLPGGGQRWLHGQGQFFDGSMIGVNIDIDQQKQAEAHLQQQWHTFDTVLSNTPDAIYIFDSEGRIEYANRTLLTRLHMSLDQVMGKDGAALGYPMEIVERVKKQIDDIFRNSQTVRDELTLLSREGGFRNYEYILVPVLNRDGMVEAVAGSTRDITERKLAEEQERKRQDQLRESAHLESLGIMAGGIAHDFNNLLTGILGNASLLTESAREEDVPLANDIVLAAERAADLTSQMLAYSGKGRFLIEVLDLNTVLRENLTLLRASLPHTVTVELSLSSQDCSIDGDRAQLQQVVMNLLLNAAEAVGDRAGKVEVRTAVVERTAEWVSARLQTVLPAGSYIVLEVRDNGAGMAADTLKKIFDPFFTTKFTGRGLGLAAVLGIVKGHRGDIEVQSEQGIGTVFTITLPASEELIAMHSPVMQTMHIPAHTGAVLVVDDEDVVRRTAAAALKSRGLLVIQAGGAAEALKILRAKRWISAVILDLAMPLMSGEEAIPLIREILPAVPIILSSGYSEAELAPRFASLGLAGFLQKPYTAAAIGDKVTRVLG